MRSFYLLIPAIVFFSCAKEKKDDSVIAIPNKAEKTIQAEKPFATAGYSNKALILSDKMDIYNDGKEVIGNEKALYGLIVDLDGISIDRFDLTNSDDHCNLHNFVKVMSPKLNGWVYGKDIYEYDVARDTTFTINEVKFILTPTKNFDIGHFDGEMLTFCADNNPVVLYNSIYNKEEFIPVNNKHEWYKDDYLILDFHDGWEDTVSGCSLHDNVLLLDIFREYQEGSANIIFEIYLKPEGTFALIKEYIPHEPEY